MPSKCDSPVDNLVCARKVKSETNHHLKILQILKVFLSILQEDNYATKWNGSMFSNFG